MNRTRERNQIAKRCRNDCPPPQFSKTGSAVENIASTRPVVSFPDSIWNGIGSDAAHHRQRHLRIPPSPMLRVAAAGQWSRPLARDTAGPGDCLAPGDCFVRRICSCGAYAARRMWSMRSMRLAVDAAVTAANRTRVRSPARRPSRILTIYVGHVYRRRRGPMAWRAGAAFMIGR
jgi:hypothetical protein